MTLVTLAVLILLLALVHVRLRIVAPCEVVPEKPVALTAPLSGVIDRMLVAPGATVVAGELLAVYDQRVAREELKVAEQQVEVVAASLRRARVDALGEQAARAEIALLENRIAQERTRLAIAQYRVSQLDLRAPEPGVVVVDDPSEWRGRPVQPGERILLLVDPARTKLRIWLPVDDRIAFEESIPGDVILNVDPGRTRHVLLAFLSPQAEPGADGLPSFRAEGAWMSGQAPGRLGLRGTVVLYGDYVSLGYWVLRKPLSGVRRWLGF